MVRGIGILICMVIVAASAARGDDAPTTQPAAPTTQQAATTPMPPASPATAAPSPPPADSHNHLEHVIGLSPAWQAAGIVAATLISEDLTCIAVGSLIGKGKIDWRIAGVACFVGIYIGDLLFFLIGRALGSRVMKMRFFARSLGEERLRKFGEFFDRRPWAAIAACRILPGLRVPLYVTVGALSTRTRAFFWWTCLFAFVWTPALIALVAVWGETFTGPFERVVGQGWVAIVVEIVLIYALIRFAILMSTRSGRRTLAHRLRHPFRRHRPTDPDLAAAEMDELLAVESKLERRGRSGSGPAGMTNDEARMTNQAPMTNDQ